MSNKKRFQVCCECHKKMERCRPTLVDEHGELQYVCRRCWKEREYDNWLYAHNEGKRSES